MTSASLITRLRDRRSTMLEQLEALVGVESPSSDLAATRRCAAVVAGMGAGLLGAEPQQIESENRVHLLWKFGTATSVLLVGHLDTVWPLGTIEEWPFSVADDIATGPGAFDMKAGLVQGFHALAMLDDLDGVAMLVTADEELGSPSSRRLVEASAAGATAALILEPSAAGGALKTARKGVSLYQIEIEGRAAHAGLEPERGVNALIELAHETLAMAALADPVLGTTVTPTVAAAGTAANVVPASARLTVDVRAATPEEQRRVDGGMGALAPVLPGARRNVRGGVNRPPLDERASSELFDRATYLAHKLGLGPLTRTSVGGGSDGNFTAGMGVPTLDGLGAVGGGAHAREEHVVVSAMPQRAALVTALVRDRLQRPR